jgi:uncharacterized membrane protein YtjA (UPF0391 family)
MQKSAASAISHRSDLPYLDREERGRLVMLSYAVTFLIIALVAGLLGFWVVAGTAAAIAKICFFLFLVMFLLSLVFGGSRA